MREIWPSLVERAAWRVLTLQGLIAPKSGAYLQWRGNCRRLWVHRADASRLTSPGKQRVQFMSSKVHNRWNRLSQKINPSICNAMYILYNRPS